MISVVTGKKNIATFEANNDKDEETLSKATKDDVDAAVNEASVDEANEIPEEK